MDCRKRKKSGPEVTSLDASKEQFMEIPKKQSIMNKEQVMEVQQHERVRNKEQARAQQKGSRLNVQKKEFKTKKPKEDKGKGQMIVFGQNEVGESSEANDAHLIILWFLPSQKWMMIRKQVLNNFASIRIIPCPEKGFYVPSINQRDPTLEHNNPKMGEITINSVDRIFEKLSTERTNGTMSLRFDSIQDLDYSEEFAGMAAFSEEYEPNAELFEEESAEEHVSGAPSSQLVPSVSAVPFIPLNVKNPPPFLLEEIHR
ncbi:unnamed protein product [Ilex paraguariensis]|uniref:Uncharacterized protein n=1 Tax=Ilex paraguariensis TaxID=185542 RepID=A0ABC8RSA8_9AQUA